MKKHFSILMLFLLPLFSISQDAKKALVIGIDGCRSDALEVANTPNIDELISSGIFSPDALNDDITISGPGWSAILCGVWSNKHLVTGNGFDNSNYDFYPSFFRRAEAFDQDLHTVSICHWSPINDLIVSDQADFKLNVQSDNDVAAQASAYLSVNDPDIVFLHFDEADGAGHSHGFAPDVLPYTSTIEHIDSLIGVVIQAIQNRDSYAEEDWLILMTTDHGGLGTSHGGNSLEEERIFFLASGKNVDPAIILRDSIIMDLEIENCLGDSIELRFDGDDDFVQIPVSPILNFDADQDFTLECRIRTTIRGDVAIIGNKNWESGLNKGFVFSFKFPSGPEWKVNIGDGVNRADINVGGEIADGEWHTLSVSFDRDGLMKMYQNGIYIDATDISFIGDISTNTGLFLGTDINSNFDFEGSISEVRIWDKVLEEESINNWFCRRIESTHPEYGSLIGYWKLNEGIGSTQLNDYSLNNNPGSIFGAAWEIPDTTIITYDYTHTPRLIDVFPTLFNHLCIPIEDDWNLDGSSLIPECQTTTTSIHSENEAFNMNICPNPSNGQVVLELIGASENIDLIADIYNLTGNKLLTKTISNAHTVIDMSSFNQGSYFVSLTGKNEKQITKKFIIRK